MRRIALTIVVCCLVLSACGSNPQEQLRSTQLDMVNLLNERRPADLIRAYFLPQHVAAMKADGSLDAFIASFIDDRARSLVALLEIVLESEPTFDAAGDAATTATYVGGRLGSKTVVFKRVSDRWYYVPAGPVIAVPDAKPEAAGGPHP